MSRPCSTLNYAGAGGGLACSKPVLTVLFPCFSPVVSTRIPASTVNPARGRGAWRKNREISTNKLLQTRIPYLNQTVDESRKRPEPPARANPVDRSPSRSPIALAVADTHPGVGLGGRA